MFLYPVNLSILSIKKTLYVSDTLNFSPGFIYCIDNMTGRKKIFFSYTHCIKCVDSVDRLTESSNDAIY